MSVHFLQSGIRVRISGEGQKMPRLHGDFVYNSSRFMLSLHGLPHQLFMVVCVCAMCGGHCSSRRVAVHATGAERHSYAKYSTW